MCIRLLKLQYWKFSCKVLFSLEEVAEAGPFKVPLEAPSSPNSHFDGMPSLHCSPKKSLQTKRLSITERPFTSK